MFTLTNSCLTTSNLPWFIYQFSMQYCSLQHWTLLSLPETSTTGHRFCFDSVSLLLLEQFLWSYPEAYWTLINLGGLSFSVIFFAFSYCSQGPQGKNADVVCYSLLQCTTFCQKSPPRLVCLEGALQGMAHNFIELDKAVIHVIILVTFLWLWFLFCLPSDGWG